MCNGIVETIILSGSGKGTKGWFALDHAHVSHDHPTEAPFDDAVIIDFVNEKGGVGARVAVEIDTDSARKLADAILVALSRQH